MSANYQSMNYVSVHKSGEGQLSVDILAGILANSCHREWADMPDEKYTNYQRSERWNLSRGLKKSPC